MTEKQGNELIREFMGFTYFEELQYSTSWDWLMPACRRWNNLKVKPELETEHRRLSKAIDTAVTLYDITLIFNQLVKNIEWLNLQEK